MAPPSLSSGPMACAEMAVYCFDTLLAHYSGTDIAAPLFQDAHYALFVTWKRLSRNGDTRLRGCIGTLEARRIVPALKEYALTSALRDRRFSPIAHHEIPHLECTVSLLFSFETAHDHLDWEVGKHGLIINFTDSYGNQRSATYLPEVASQEGWSRQEAIDSLMRKSGHNGAITESLRRSLHVTRYQSSLHTMSYGEYQAHCAMRQALPHAQVSESIINEQNLDAAVHLNITNVALA
eukprot:jgi/Chlat1/5899/Chrsp4S06399